MQSGLGRPAEPGWAMLSDPQDQILESSYPNSASALPGSQPAITDKAVNTGTGASLFNRLALGL